MEKLSSIEQLIESFASLPGVGHKSAEKMAYSVLNMDEELIEQFADSLINVKKSVHKCPRCGSLTENDLYSGNVLNGITYNEVNKTFLITGKEWGYLYEVELN